MLAFGFALALAAGFAHAHDLPDRGAYFDKKVYVSEPVPNFQNSRDLVPEPILDDHPEWIRLYWEAWQLAFAHFKAPPRNSPLVSNYADAAFSLNIYQWDSIFMIQAGRYGNSVFPIVQSLDNFYCRQHVDGYISREIESDTGNDYIWDQETIADTVNPPLFAWAEVRNAQLTGDRSRYNSVYLPLVKYAEYLEIGRHSLETKHKLYWNTPLGSGMDDIYRTGSGWVDMSSQMVIMYHSLAEIARDLGYRKDALRFELRASDIAKRIQRFMWDEKDGLFYDIDDNGEFIKKKTVASFWPLLAGITTPKQTARLIEHLRDPREFWRHNVFPALAADDPDYRADGGYWTGGVWAPTNLAIIEGLNAHEDIPGSRQLAKEASEKYLSNISEVFERTGTIWEYYAPDNASHGPLARPNFVGWSDIGPIELLIEDVLGFEVNGIQQQVTWRVRNAAHHGIRKLRVGAVLVNLEAKQDGDVLNVNATVIPDSGARDQDVKLHLIWGSRHTRKFLKPGETRFQIKRFPTKIQS